MPEEPWIHVIQLQEKLQAMQLIKYQTSSRIRTKLKKKNDLMLWYFYHARFSFLYRTAACLQIFFLFGLENGDQVLTRGERT